MNVLVSVGEIRASSGRIFLRTAGRAFFDRLMDPIPLGEIENWEVTFRSGAPIGVPVATRQFNVSGKARLQAVVSPSYLPSPISVLPSAALNTSNLHLTGTVTLNSGSEMVCTNVVCMRNTSPLISL